MAKRRQAVELIARVVRRLQLLAAHHAFGGWVDGLKQRRRSRYVLAKAVARVANAVAATAFSAWAARTARQK